MYSRSVKFSGITSPSRPPTLRNITSSVTSSNVEHARHLKTTARRSMTSQMTWYFPWGGVGQFFLGESQSRIYPNMCAKFGCDPTVVLKRGVQRDRQTDGHRDTEALYSRLFAFSLVFSVTCYKHHLIRNVCIHVFLSIT